MLSRFKGKSALVYLDDGIIYSKAMTEHAAHVWEAMQLLQKTGVTLKLMRCTFLDTVAFHLHHSIRPGQFEVDT